MAMTAGTEGYREAADALAVQYEGVTFAEVQSDVMALFPAPPTRVLDVGAGTGRDAAALARLGHPVVAVEPTAELRAHGRRLHAGAGFEWVDDALPELAVLRRNGERFGLVLITAVWMHLDRAERALAMSRVVELLDDGGLLFLSLRHGPVPPGRRMFEVSADETEESARRCGLSAVHRSGRADLHGRPGVSWTRLGFRRGPTGP